MSEKVQLSSETLKEINTMNRHIVEKMSFFKEKMSHLILCLNCQDSEYLKGMYSKCTEGISIDTNANDILILLEEFISLIDGVDASVIGEDERMGG